MKNLIAVLAIAAAPISAAAATCEELAEQYGKFDGALTVFDRASGSESSTLRADTAQSAMTNILLRQNIIMSMMIAGGCELPAPPDFLPLGLITSRN